MGQLEVNNLVKRLGDNLVVDGVSFAVNEGEFFVLLGPSGSGKSTLLRLICGLETPDSGSIQVNKRDITRLPPRERNLGMVFQDYGLYPNMNVYQNIAYGLEARGVPRAEIARRIPPAAEKLGLTAHLKSGIVDLSGGEQQRVALARAMVKDADAYLYDEPLSNLDPKLRHKARRDIMTVHKEKHKPSVYVTHDQSEAFAMGDRIAVLAKGKLQQVGTAEALLHQPANLFIAMFVGSPPINLVEGTIATENQEYYFYGDGIALKLPQAWHHPLNHYDMRKIILGLRPDALTVPESDVDEDSLVSGAVEYVEPLLGETIVGMKVGSRTSLSAALQDTENESLNVGESLRVSIDTERLLFFDVESEKAIAI